jgi:hypothetical protein
MLSRQTLYRASVAPPPPPFFTPGVFRGPGRRGRRQNFTLARLATPKRGSADLRAPRLRFLVFFSLPATSPRMQSAAVLVVVELVVVGLDADAGAFYLTGLRSFRRSPYPLLVLVHCSLWELVCVLLGCQIVPRSEPSIVPPLCHLPGPWAEEKVWKNCGIGRSSCFWPSVVQLGHLWPCEARLAANWEPPEPEQTLHRASVVPPRPAYSPEFPGAQGGRGRRQNFTVARLATLKRGSADLDCRRPVAECIAPPSWLRLRLSLTGSMLAQVLFV